MKLSLPKDNGNAKRAPLLPLAPEEDNELNSSNSVSYSLRVNPTAADSPTHKKCVRVLTGGEDVRTVLTWVSDTAMVITGLNITDPKNEYTLLKNLVKGSAQNDLLGFCRSRLQQGSRSRSSSRTRCRE